MSEVPELLVETRASKGPMEHCWLAALAAYYVFA